MSKVQCHECLIAFDVAMMYNNEMCLTCAREEGLTDRTEAVQQHKRMENEKARLERERHEAAEEAERRKQAAFDKRAEAKKLLAERETARRYLLPYIKRNIPNYEAGWVHADICQRLEKFAQDVVDRKSPRLMLFLPPRAGKQVADSTEVLTANRGWVTHGDLVVGDYVYGRDGRPVKVIAVSEKTPSDVVMHFSNGDSIRCHENHEWTLFSRPDKKEITVETRYFLDDSNRGIPRKITSGEMGKRGGRYQYQLPERPVISGTESALTLDPYVLGAWLGDGSRGKGCLTHDKKDGAIVDEFEKRGYAVSAVCTHKVTGVLTTYFSGPRPGVIGRLLRELREVGVEHDKFIPDAYLSASVKQRLELLAGLIDTDGHVCTPTSRVGFTTSDEPLAVGVKALVNGLGMHATVECIEPRLSTSGIQGRKVYWRVSFQPRMDIPTVLPRKKIKKIKRPLRPSLVKVERSPNGEVGHCIQVDSPDGLYVVGRNFTLTHNSEIGSIQFPSWFLGKYPELEVIISSYSGDLAAGFSRKVRNIFDSESFGQVFRDAKLSKDSKAADKWSTTKGGGLNAVGVSGSLSGKGGSVLICDDPHKDRDEAESETKRQTVKDWYSSTFYTRRAPGAGILVIQTRWHEDDLSGWLLAEQQANEKKEGEGGSEYYDRWEVVKYPAVAKDDEKFRKKGEALHPQRFPIEELMMTKSTLIPRDWEALYQQEPVSDDGDYFTKDMFRFYRPQDVPPHDELRIYAAGDLAISTKQSADYSVFVVVGIDRKQNIWLLDLLRGRWDSLGIIDKLFFIQENYNPELLGIEEGQIELALSPIIHKIEQERGITINYEKLKVRGQDKASRARPLQGRMQQGKFLFPDLDSVEWMRELYNEMLKFPLGTNDDQVDALAWIGRMLMMLGVKNEKREKPKPSFRDKLHKYGGGASGRRHKSGMSA